MTKYHSGCNNILESHPRPIYFSKCMFISKRLQSNFTPYLIFVDLTVLLNLQQCMMNEQSVVMIHARDCFAYKHSRSITF